MDQKKYDLEKMRSIERFERCGIDEIAVIDSLVRYFHFENDDDLFRFLSSLKKS